MGEPDQGSAAAEEARRALGGAAGRGCSSLGMTVLRALPTPVRDTWGTCLIAAPP